MLVSPESINDYETMDRAALIQCADSFDEFLTRWYIECELWWRLKKNAPAEMTPEMVQYLDHYRAR